MSLFIRCTTSSSRLACFNTISLSKQSVALLGSLAQRNHRPSLACCHQAVAVTFGSGVPPRRHLHTSGGQAAVGATSSSSNNTMEGTCLCKAIALKVTDDDLFGGKRRGHLCHCANCRKVAGGLFGANLIIEEEKVEWMRGRDVVKVYEVRTVFPVLVAGLIWGVCL